jgi:transcriptional regulator GlxA family with amidase domain
MDPQTVMEPQNVTRDTLLTVLAELVDAADVHLETDRARARACLSRASMLLHHEREPAVGEIRSGGLPHWQARQVRIYIDANLGCPISTDELTAIVSMSTSHFFRSFKASFGEPPFSYIARRRVARAQKLMLTTEDPLCDIALACGFCDQSHFTRVFRRFAGQSPFLWRQQMDGRRPHQGQRESMPAARSRPRQ